MAIRMTGIISGLDTDAIIKELMSAQSLKKTKVEQKKTKVEWKQEKWAELNTKLYALYTKQAAKMKLQGSYLTKKATSSNESAVTATANSSAASGSHTIKVNQLASSQYVTGDKISGVTSKSKLVDLGVDIGTIIKVGDKDGNVKKTLTINTDTTVASFVSALQDAGLNASFDESQGRFFISSKESGSANAFTITTSVVNSSTNAGQALADARAELETALGSNISVLDDFYKNYSAALETQKEKQEAYEEVYNDADATDDEKIAAWEELAAVNDKIEELENDLIKVATDAADKAESTRAKAVVINNYITNFKADTTADEYKEVVEVVDKVYYKYDEDGNKTSDYTEAAIAKAKEAIKADAEKAIEQEILAGTVYATTAEKQAAVDAKYEELIGTTEAEQTAAVNAKLPELYEASLNTAIEAKGTEYAATDAGKQAIETEKNQATIDAAGDAVETALGSYIMALEALELAGEADGTKGTEGQLAGLGLIDITSGILDGTESSSNSNVTVITASDSEIELDGAVLTGSSNSFTAAGLTLELKAKTTGTTTISVTNDADAVYDRVKEFFKEYNSILEEMNKLYNAESARGYDPLTDDEKEAMTEEQIELWETKIKDSLLRRDSTLGSLCDAMRSAMQTSVTIDGKTYSLASYGIMTSSDYTERGLLHIYGDEDDATYATETDKLKAALTEDPDTVAKVLSEIMDKLSDTMMDKMKKTTLSSALTFYNDKELKNQVDDYEDEIEKWEDKLQDIEDRYYNQFSAMETALAKLQSQSNYLANLMGTSTS